jgi:hypothetical protein
MPTVANMPAADLEVTFPSGKKKTVFMPRMLVQTQNAEFKRDHNMFLPGVGKQHPTVKALREEYELDYFFDAPVRTWADCAAVMRHVYTVFTDHIKASLNA